MKKFKIVSIFIVVGIMFSIACTKQGTNGPVGSSNIKGTITYKNSDGSTGTCINPLVHIAYNASSATTNYNETIVGGTDGSYSIQGLGTGDYYLDAEYTNAEGLHYTCPGVHVKLGNNTDAITADMVVQ